LFVLLGVATKAISGVSVESPDIEKMKEMYEMTKQFIGEEDISLIEDSVERSFSDSPASASQGAEECASGSGLNQKVQKLTGNAYTSFKEFLVGEHGADKMKSKLGTSFKH